MSFKPVVIIPHYNHSDTLPKVIEKLKSYDLPIMVVDDGSSEQHKITISHLVQQNVEIVYHPENKGKGAALKTGLQLAFDQGFSHALQVDADGQHDLTDVIKLIEKSQQNSTALICGLPVYGDDAPKSRLYGRKITNFWLAVNTLSLDIKDGMCGFRVYPLAQIIPILQSTKLGDRMEFDSEILVYSHWRKIPFYWVETPVKYELGGISHFQGWADNIRISKMHARLFFTMLARLFTGKMS
ncbi:glycosyltransferase family 2 protein [Lonepinella sp. MS14436]|uniref:glycosyltransferase family 2 protein n=1 Tax=Lonepinella sp. MS14436 TaxID=3003619 RepID=UPI0036DDB5C1